MGEEKELTEEQRRADVRVQTVAPCLVRLAGERVQNCHLADLSGRGCSFVSIDDPGEIRRGRISISFDDGYELDTTFIVIGIEPAARGHLVRAHFDDLPQNESDRVIRQVFAIQREQLRRVRGE